MEKKINTHKLPSGWLLVKLEDISKQITDGSHNPPRNMGSGIPMLSARNIENNRISFEEVRYIGEEDFKYENQKTKIEVGDVLLTIVGTIGRCAYISENIDTKFTLQRSVAAIKPLISGKYLMYYIQSPNFQKQLIDNAKGTAQKGIYLKKLSSLELPLPPLNEQNRIVSKIEELFSELDHAELGLKKAQIQLDINRQVLLKNAFIGKLLSKDSDLKYNWRRINLGDVVVKKSQKAKPDNNSELKFIGLECINANSLKLSSTFLFKNYSSTASYFKKGDIIYSRMRPNLNKVYKVEFDGVCSGEFFVLEGLDIINTDFLKYLLHSSEFVRYATKKAAGDRPRLSFKDFCDYQFYIPKIEEQNLIVQEIESRITLMDNLNDSITIGLKKIVTLQDAILKNAFEGSLIPQNSNDESAFNLLRKITTQKDVYLTKRDSDLKNKIKPNMKQNLINTIENNFSETPFTFEELSKVTSMSYDDIKEQLYELLDKESKLTSIFSKDAKCIIFKYKK
ncbi:MAG: restriction endonuclease subunit S [Paludibacter sp.]|nr:restriction endonuclease subunit S [Paludibacter sp.]